MSARSGRLHATGLLASALVLALCASASGVEGPVQPAPSARPAPETTIPLAAHRATYKVTLLKAVGAKSPTSARGRVAYEFVGSSCEGYSQIFRQVTELQPAEGQTRYSDMRSATYEDGEAKSFSFDIKTTSDNNAPDIIDGHADKKKGDVLAIKLSKPNAQAVEVDNDVLFPTAHLRRLIASAKAGQRIVGAKVFDGSDDGKKIYDTTAIIGRTITGPADAAARGTTMDTMRRWPVTISYFDLGKKDEEPAYTLGFELYENGVSRALRFNYGDFVLAGEIDKFELLPTKPCKP